MEPLNATEIGSSDVKLAWKEPENIDGSPLRSYELQMASQDHFETVFEGLAVEYEVKQLNPKSTYTFRVRTKTPLLSGWSTPLQLTTSSTCWI